MVMEMRGLVIFGVFSILISMAYSIPGTATFYTNYVPSACYGDKWKGVLIAAAGDELWNNGAVCGKKFTVKCTGSTKPVPRPCTGKSMTVTIVDHHPGYNETLALSRETFDVIANPDAGIIEIDYYMTSE